MSDLITKAKETLRTSVILMWGVVALSSVGYGQQPETERLGESKTGQSETGQPRTQRPIWAGGHVSMDVINLFLAREVDEVTELRQGDQVLGKAHTLGRVTVELIPNPQAAFVDVHLQGVSRLLDRPAGRKAFFGKTNVESEIDARKRIVVDLNGLATLPAVADCQASLKGGLANLGLKDQPFAEKLMQGVEGLASMQTGKRVREQLDTEVDQTISKASDRLQHQPWLPLDQAITLVEMLTFSTTSEHAGAQVFCASEDAPEYPRQLDPSFDVHVVVHETLVGSLATEWFSGRRIEDREWLDHVERMRGRAGWGLWVHARRPRWAVTLTKKQPISLLFDQNQVHLRLQINHVEYGGDSLETPIEVYVVLQPEITEEGHCLRRVLGPVVTYLDGERNSQRESFAAMLERKFDAFFAEEICFDGVKTPSSGSWSRFGQIELVEFSAEQGWFTVGFSLKGGSANHLAAQVETEAPR